MTAPSAFTDDEWDLISLTPVAVGLAVAKAGRSGLVGSVQETRALIESIDHGDRTHPVNEVIQALVADDRYPRSELIKAAIATVLVQNLERVTPTVGTSAEALATAAIEDCDAVGAVLDDKATEDEAADYRQWLLGIARQVAETANESGVTVSRAEADLIDRITAALF